MTRIDLTGLGVRPAQVWGGVRLVPLVRAEPVGGLRLHREAYGSGVRRDGGGRDGGYVSHLSAPSSVDAGDGTVYTSYIPHGFVADWSGTDREEAVYGTRLGDGPPATVPLRAPHHRFAKRRRGERRLRFLPLHLALDGYLSLHFGGPPVLWEEWSRDALRRGLSPRAEAAYAGVEVPGLAEALRIFELHPGQCGVLVYAADALAGAFVVPHPEDYRLLHPTLVEDLYGEQVHQYAHYGAPVPDFTARIRDGAGGIRNLADLRAAAREQERRWAEAHDGLMGRDLLETPYAFERVYRMGSFALYRFLPPFLRDGREQHIGELITDHKGRTAYLKTFRLSDAQVRRGYLLRRLASCDWHVGRAAEALGTAPEELVRRIRAAGFGELLDAHGLAQARRKRQEG
ncbi:ARPP-2 domain-containing protein [Streptomyces omiyaensis]|uniref:ARG and Rhodanese-Phosphatase-superfamily-associated domain-containing protein n=1 Tax=Streptomyces omiyaensis TaxID=68247 RepID=A0ABW7BNF9_9ACTN